MRWRGGELLIVEVMLHARFFLCLFAKNRRASKISALSLGVCLYQDAFMT
jgi:hypothetical protein